MTCFRYVARRKTGGKTGGKTGRFRGRTIRSFTGRPDSSLNWHRYICICCITGVRSQDRQKKARKSHDPEEIDWTWICFFFCWDRCTDVSIWNGIICNPSGRLTRFGPYVVGMIHALHSYHQYAVEVLWLLCPRMPKDLINRQSQIIKETQGMAPN